ncbi:MAG: serpin family protein [archaeon]
MKTKILLLGIIISLFLISCSSTPNPITVNDDNATVEGVNGVIQDNNELAIKLYKEINKEGENLFFSPYSISTAFAMTYEGAKGQTAKEMEEVFGFSTNDDDRRPSFASLYNTINKKDKEYKLSTANALWTNKDYEFLPEYLNTIENYYGGKTTNLDFSKSTKSAKIINDWVEDQTNNKIKNLVPESAINPMTKMVLTNAIYFKGDWIKQFEPKDTYETNFKITPENKIKIDMMVQDDSDAKFNYAETDELQILEMKYKSKEVSMLVLLPKEDDLTALEESLNTANLAVWNSMLEEQRVDLYFPKFKLETTYGLNENMINLGMPTAFSEGIADFSGMDGTKDLFISKVIHKAFVEVDEQGTEAAAATAIMMGATSAGPMYPIFKADHPFIFIIQEKSTGSILFMGKVVNPRG